MIVIVGEILFGAGEIERLRPLMDATVVATCAEDGCVSYAYSIDIGDPNLLHFAARWRDEASLAAHLKLPHFAKMVTALEAADILRMETFPYRADRAGALLAASGRGLLLNR